MVFTIFEIKVESQEKIDYLTKYLEDNNYEFDTEIHAGFSAGELELDESNASNHVSEKRKVNTDLDDS